MLVMLWDLFRCWMSETTNMLILFLSTQETEMYRKTRASTLRRMIGFLTYFLIMVRQTTGKLMLVISFVAPPPSGHTNHQRNEHYPNMIREL